MVTAAMKLKRQLLLAIKPMTILDSELKKQRHYFANKVPCSQSYGFSSSHVWMWDLDHIGGWAQKNWCFRSIMLEKTLESPLDCKRIKSVNPKGYQPWIFTGWTDAKTEAAMLWPPDVKEPTHWERPWCWGRLKAKREGGQRIRWLNSIMNSMDKNLSKL